MLSNLVPDGELPTALNTALLDTTVDVGVFALQDSIMEYEQASGREG